MMKRIVLCCLVLLLVSGCHNGNKQTDVEKVMQELTEEKTGENGIKEIKNANTEETVVNDDEVVTYPLPENENTEGYDIDLTVLSSTMVYSEVYNIVSEPDVYVGKTMKIHGYFGYYYAETDGRYHFGCIIPDATACCAQGIEFELTDDLIFPDDYPEAGAEITVTGVFGIGEIAYTLGKDDLVERYCVLTDAVMYVNE